MRIAATPRSRASFLYLLCLLAFLSLIFHDSTLLADTPPDAPSVILIQNATILTVSHGIIEHGSILIKDGKIAAVGQGLKAPDGVQIEVIETV